MPSSPHASTQPIILLGESNDLLGIAPTSSALITQPIPLLLKPYVRSWAGYSEKNLTAYRRRELPGPHVVLVIEFGQSLRMFKSATEGEQINYPSGLVAGLGDSCCWSGHEGTEEGIVINLTPIGAWRFFGIAQHHLSRSVIDFSDLLTTRERSIPEQLANTPSWNQRFRIVEDLLHRKISATSSTPSAIVWAVSQIEAQNGTLAIELLARDIGYSRKHLVSLFNEYVGFPPKLYANLVRFDQVIRALKRRPEISWADLAIDFNFSDQSHMSREIKRFSGMSPQSIHRLLR